MGTQSLLQGIFATQGSSPGFPHCRWILYHMSLQGSPETIYTYSVLSNSLRPHGLQPTRLLCPWGSSRQESWSGLSKTIQAGQLVGQGMIPTATTGPEATTDIHKLYPLPLVPLFLHLQLAWSVLSPREGALALLTFPRHCCCSRPFSSTISHGDIMPVPVNP